MLKVHGSPFTIGGIGEAQENKRQAWACLVLYDWQTNKATARANQSFKELDDQDAPHPISPFAREAFLLKKKVPL